MERKRLGTPFNDEQLPRAQFYQLALRNLGALYKIVARGEATIRCLCESRHRGATSVVGKNLAKRLVAPKAATYYEASGPSTAGFLVSCRQDIASRTGSLTHPSEHRATTFIVVLFSAPRCNSTSRAIKLRVATFGAENAPRPDKVLARLTPFSSASSTVINSLAHAAGT